METVRLIDVSESYAFPTEGTRFYFDGQPEDYIDVLYNILVDNDIVIIRTLYESRRILDKKTKQWTLVN